MIFVQAVDSNYYVNPKIGGKNWFLDCTDDGIFVRVKEYEKTTFESASKRANKLLKGVGVKAKILGSLGEETVLFPPKFDSLENSLKLAVKINSPIPIPEFFEQAVNTPSLEHAMLSWRMEFDKSDLLDVFNTKRPINKMLAKFLIGGDAHLKSSNSIRTVVADWLMECLPGLRKFKKNPINWFDGKPERILVEL